MTYKVQITSNPAQSIVGGVLGDVGSQLSGLIGQVGGLISGGVGLPGINSLGGMISTLSSSIQSSNAGTSVAGIAGVIQGLGSQLSSASSFSGLSSILSSMQSQLSSLLSGLNPSGLLSNALHIIQLDKAQGILSSAFQGQHSTTWNQQGVTHTSSTSVTSTAPVIPHNGLTTISDMLQVGLGILAGTFVNAQSFGMISDKALKRKIEKHHPTLDDVMKLELKTFEVSSIDPVTGLPIDEFKPSIGLIAQDVKKVFPGIVGVGERGYLTIEETKVGMLLLGAFQEYVTESRAEIAALKAEIAELRQ